MSVFNNIFNGMARGFAFGTFGFNPFYNPCCCNFNPLFYTSNPFIGGGFFPVMPQISMPIFDMTPPSYDMSVCAMPRPWVPDFSNFDFTKLFENTNPFEVRRDDDDIDTDNVDVFVPSKKTKEKKKSDDKSKSDNIVSTETVQKKSLKLCNADNTKYDTLIIKYATEYGIDPNLVKAVMKQESAFNPNAKSPANAYGLMQLTEGAAKDLGVNRYDVEENIKGGVKFLKQLLDRFDGNVRLAIAAYNAGPNRSCYARGEIPNIAETKNYVKKVTKYYEEYKNA